MRRTITQSLGLLRQAAQATCSGWSASTSTGLARQVQQHSSNSTHCQASTWRPTARHASSQPYRGFATSSSGSSTNATRMPPSTGVRGGARTPAGVGGASAVKGESSDGAPISSFSRWWRAFQAAPNVPKILGLAGAIPFIALAPPVAKHLVGVLPADVVDNAAMIQVCYGVTIVSFLGAVHWGVAMSSSLAGPVAARIANEGFVYSVIPSLCAWPVALMEPGAGAVVLSLLLPGCYIADYARRNMGLPHWYMALRVPLTLLATFGMLLTATRHVHTELDRAKQLTQAEAKNQVAPPAAAK